MYLYCEMSLAERAHICMCLENWSKIVSCCCCWCCCSLQFTPCWPDFPYCVHVHCAYCIDFVHGEWYVFICKISTTAHCILAPVVCLLYLQSMNLCVCIVWRNSCHRAMNASLYVYRPNEFLYFCSNHTIAYEIPMRVYNMHNAHIRKIIPCHNCWVNGACNTKATSRRNKKVQAKQYRMRKGLCLVSGLVLYLHKKLVLPLPLPLPLFSLLLLLLLLRGQTTSWMHQYSCANVIMYVFLSMYSCTFVCIEEYRISAALGYGWSHTSQLCRVSWFSQNLIICVSGYSSLYHGIK